jgi:hypothetical protein
MPPIRLLTTWSPACTNQGLFLAFGTGDVDGVERGALDAHRQRVLAVVRAAGAHLQPHAAAGILIAPVIPTRPHHVVVIALLGLWLGLQRRSWRVLLHFAVPAVVAVAGLLVWNHHMYGAWSIGGGYTGSADALTSSHAAAWTYVRDVAGTLGSPLRGPAPHWSAVSSTS